MKTSDIGLVFDDKLSTAPWMKFYFVDECPDALWFGTADTPIGDMTVIGNGDDGLCYIGFNQERSLEKCRHFFPQAEFYSDQKKAKAMVGDIMKIWAGEGAQTIKFIVRGTDFQKRVWDALMHIPAGHAVSYGTVAAFIGSPRAVRAVGTAVGANPISLLIPCHRVVQQSGKVENYGWGDAMKQELLKAETAMRISKSPASRKSRQVA